MDLPPPQGWGLGHPEALRTQNNLKVSLLLTSGLGWVCLSSACCWPWSH